MKVYKFTGSSTIEVDNKDVKVDKQVKIKVTHVMPTISDVNLFSGAIKREYPFIGGHIALGVVSDNRDEYGLKRGTKVIINPYAVARSEREGFPDTVKTRGIDSDGLMQDFVALDLDRFVPFPDDVEESDAIFVDDIAVALSALNGMNGSKGDYVAIIGAGPVGNIIAQLALYFQMIPIVIDGDDYRLSMARKEGIYYTVNGSVDVPYEKVFEITGGRMCEHTVIQDTSYITGAYLFMLARDGGNVTIISEPYSTKTLDADVSMISKKHLTVRGVSGGAEEFDSAINFVAQKILDTDGFIERKVTVDHCEEHFAELEQNPDLYFSSIIEF